MVIYQVDSGVEHFERVFVGGLYFFSDAENVKTTAHYYGTMDTTGVAEKIKTTDKYPFKVFNATIDLVNDHLDANYMIGDSAIVTASGRTYPDYTSY